jgi:Histidine kinase-, DNA gyrase B-, and HSP90-like ATPase
VACLLRMGDLLDLDDNRFCPVMQRISGENRSKISKAHEDKHAGISHLRIDRERIEISAECETIDGYLETFKWFGWLKQEIQDQMANWQDIVPNRDLGLLPTLGSITVRLGGELQILKEGQRPQFGVDDEKAIELLQGNNLYSTKFACVRELLQNAIDATLLSLWLTKKNNISSEDWESPFSHYSKELLKSAHVTVDLVETPSVDVNTGKTVWTLTITDQGTGISQADLAYMLRIGGSQRNTQRQNMINAMPEWMKPSGAFGIGIQSVFLLCDEITLITKSIFTNEILQVTMHNPTGSKEGLVLLKLLDNDISRSHGTTIEIRLQLDTFAKSWSISYGDQDSIASQFVNSMDPVLDCTFPFEAAQMADQIQAFAAKSPLRIKANLTTTDKNYDVMADATPINEVSDEWKFVKTNDGHELAIMYRPTGPYYHPHNMLKTYYRGQPFEYKGGDFPHVRVAVDLMSGKAGTWLNANRDKLAPDAEKVFAQTILSGLEQQVRIDIENSCNCELLSIANRPAYSFFLEAMARRYGEPWVSLAKEIADSWLDLSCSETNKFRDYFETDSWIIGEEASHGEPPLIGCDLLIRPSWGGYTLSVILNEWLKNDTRTVQVIVPEAPSTGASAVAGTPQSTGNTIAIHAQDTAKYRLIYQLKKGSQLPYSPQALAARLAGAIRETAGNRRFILNCDDRWSCLFLKPDTSVNASPLFNVFPRDAKFVLLPFLYRSYDLGGGRSIECTDEQLNALCKWVVPHLVTLASVSDIHKAYEELITYIDDEIMQQSSLWDVWKRARGLS